MKNKFNLKNKTNLQKLLFLVALFLMPLVSFGYSGTATNFYTPSSSSYSGTATNYYTPSSYSGTATNYYKPSSYGGTATNYYTPSSYSYGGTATNYYTPSSSYVNSYLPSSLKCSGSSCSGSTAGTYRYGTNSGGYNYGSTGGYSYLPSQGNSGGGILGGALGLNLNYSDNDTIITDNSDNSVRIRNNIRNSSTTITNTCSNGNNASSSGNCNTVNNYVVASNDNPNNDRLEAICRVSDTRIQKGDTVKFTVEIDGGKPNYRIEWDGDIDGDDDEERVKFNKTGTYRVSVEVRDANGDRASDDCAVIRVEDEDDDEDDDRRITVTTGTNLNTPNGNLSSLESLYLSQVPYTGASDVLKTLGILAVVAVWSAAIAMYLRKQRAVKAISNKISAFKSQNKNSNKIA